LQGVQHIVGRGGTVQPRGRPKGEGRTRTAHDRPFYPGRPKVPAAIPLERLHVDGTENSK
jgi:hypothetical protein